MEALDPNGRCGGSKRGSPGDRPRPAGADRPPHGRADRRRAEFVAGAILVTLTLLVAAGWWMAPGESGNAVGPLNPTPIPPRGDATLTYTAVTAPDVSGAVTALILGFMIAGSALIGLFFYSPRPVPGSPAALPKRRRRLRLRVLLMHGALQTDQAGQLVLLVLGLMHPRPTVHFAGPQTPAIDLDGDHLRGTRHARRQLPTPALVGLRVAGPGQVGADLVRQLLDVACRDRQAGQAQGEGGVGEGVQAGAGGDDLLEQP